jgi:transcriptional regulator with XRE-family HTH domain
MKNKRLEARRKKISKDIDIYVKHSFDIVDRIHEILEMQDKEQKDLAKALGKSESEISKWMSGTHNFTIKTIAKMESVLGESIIQPTKNKRQETPTVVILSDVEYLMRMSKKSSSVPTSWETILNANTQKSSKYLD